MPAFTRFYGLRPWEIERLTQDEIEQYLIQLADYEREVERQSGG